MFDSYPIYIKHTLFNCDENIAKIRKTEITQRFFAQDGLKEEGNWYYRKRNYTEAMKYYEAALSCVKWLEYVPEKNEKKSNFMPDIDKKY